MPTATRLLAAIAGLFVATGAALPAQALSLQTGEVALFNFDFTGQTPSPPYSNSIIAHFLTPGMGPGIFATFDVFGGLNATGADILTIATAPLQGVQSVEVLAGVTPGADAVLDGIFSVRVTVGQGPFNIDNPVAIGLDISAFAQVAGTLGTATSIPQPAGLALFGSGLLAAASLRRRGRR